MKEPICFEDWCKMMGVRPIEKMRPPYAVYVEQFFEQQAIEALSSVLSGDKLESAIRIINREANYHDRLDDVLDELIKQVYHEELEVSLRFVIRRMIEVAESY